MCETEKCSSTFAPTRAGTSEGTANNTTPSRECVAVKVYSMVCRRCTNGTCDDKIFCPKNYEGNSKGKYIVALFDE